MPTVNEAVKRLRWNKRQHVAVAIWCEDDVLDRAKELHIKLTHKQAREIIDEIDHEQDCSIGISWDMIDNFLRDIEVKK